MASESAGEKIKAIGHQTDMRTPKLLTDAHWEGQRANMRTAPETV